VARLVLPPHLSYSGLVDYLKCGKFYQLSRVLGLEQTPAWWNVGGHAVHQATEAWDRQVYAISGG
jgi:hypothetical protein